MKTRIFNNVVVMVFALSAAPLSAWCDPNAIYDDPWFAPNIAKKDGVQKPVQILELKKDSKPIFIVLKQKRTQASPFLFA